MIYDDEDEVQSAPTAIVEGFQEDEFSIRQEERLFEEQQQNLNAFDDLQNHNTHSNKLFLRPKTSLP